MKHRFYIHPLTIPLFILIGLTPYKIRFFILYIFIFLHELSHLTVSVILGEKVSGIRLLPWGCVLNLKSVPKKKSSILIHLAGPVFNILMYFLKIYPAENLALALFNLMPVMPLDGGVIANILFKSFAFFVSLIFIVLLTFFCIYFRFPITLPILLTLLLVFGEKNRLDKTISAKVIGHFNTKK